MRRVRAMLGRVRGHVARWHERATGAGGASRAPAGRSDDRIYDDVVRNIASEPSLRRATIDVRVEEGEVTLTGEVDDRGGKYFAEALASEVSGVKVVQNELLVRDDALLEHTGYGSGPQGMGIKREK